MPERNGQALHKAQGLGKRPYLGPESEARMTFVRSADGSTSCELDLVLLASTETEGHTQILVWLDEAFFPTSTGLSCGAIQ
jgi:hypothetical protein